jgi:uncharacterized membrane protein YGL010W
MNFMKDWFARHRNRTSLLLHAIGIPLTIAAIVVLFLPPPGGWLPAVILFVVGYALQFIGHGIEGNDAGEIIIFKKLLGLPFKRYSPDDQSAQSPPKE